MSITRPDPAGGSGNHRAEWLYAMLPARRPEPLLAVYAASALITVQLVLWILLAWAMMQAVPYPFNAVSESQAKAMEQMQQYYPAILTVLGVVFMVGAHLFLLLKYVQGHRWAALVLTVLQLVGLLCALSMMLMVGVLMSQLNGAPAQTVDFLLSSDSPLYLPVYVGLPYVVLSVVTLAVLWSRGSRAYTEARSAWRLRLRLRQLEEQSEYLLDQQLGQ